MNIYDFLASRQKKTPFANSVEMAFFKKHAALLSNHEAFEPWMNPKTPFDIVRSNVIIRSLLNKEEIEDLYFTYEKKKEKGEDEALPLGEYMLSGMSDLPYLLHGGKKIYVPVFPSSLNLLYAERYEKLSVTPYRRLIRDYEAALVDPFDYYGTALFDSYFTRFVPIARAAGILFAYDYDAETCYAINREGRLDAAIALFDRDLPSPSKAHMAERLLKLSSAYFGDDPEAFYRTLVNEKLISSKCLHDYREKVSRFGEKEERRDG